MSPSIDTRECREFASEIKFLVNPAVAERIRDWAREHLAADPHADGEHGDGYPVTSVYFDTLRFDVFHRRGSYARSKYRVRRYGAGDLAFLERKLKVNGLLAKRRSIAPIGDLAQLGAQRADTRWSGYWFQRRLAARSLRPVCRIAYRRTARVAMTSNGPIRLTLDAGLRAWRTEAVAFPGNDEGVRLVPENIILELKFRREMPALFKQLVTGFALTPGRFSKYRCAASSLGCAREQVVSTADAIARASSHGTSEPRPHSAVLREAVLPAA